MADYNFEGKDQTNILGSYNSYKGKHTTAARKLELLLDLQSKNYSAVTNASINDNWLEPSASLKFLLPRQIG